MARLTSRSLFLPPVRPVRAEKAAHRTALRLFLAVVIAGCTICVHIPCRIDHAESNCENKMIDFRGKHIELAHAYFRLKRERFPHDRIGKNWAHRSVLYSVQQTRMNGRPRSLTT